MFCFASLSMSKDDGDKDHHFSRTSAIILLASVISGHLLELLNGFMEIKMEGTPSVQWN